MSQKMSTEETETAMCNPLNPWISLIMVFCFLVLSVGCLNISEFLDPSIPNASSQQWRLLDPNRPIGQPPLISSKAKQKTYFNGNRNGGNNHRNNNRRQYKSSYADRDIPSNCNGINR